MASLCRVEGSRVSVTRAAIVGVASLLTVASGAFILNVHVSQGQPRPMERKGGGYLCDLELDHLGVVAYDLIALVYRRLEELRQRVPLPGYLVPVIGMHELVVVYTVWCVAEDPLSGRMAAVQRNDVVNEGLAGSGEREGARRVWPVARCRDLLVWRSRGGH
jgi:hypothetical protein